MPTSRPTQAKPFPADRTEIFNWEGYAGTHQPSLGRVQSPLLLVRTGSYVERAAAGHLQPVSQVLGNLSAGSLSLLDVGIYLEVRLSQSCRKRHGRVQACNLSVPVSLHLGVPSSQGTQTELQLKFGYAITYHKAQGSEWNNVFVKCKSHQSQLTADYFRWFYTAITRPAKNLYLLDPPDFRPWGSIKMVSNPALDMLGAVKAAEAPPAAPAPPPQPAPASSQWDSDTFGIPESATVLLSLLAEVRRLTDGKDITVEEVRHNQWLESYHFKRGVESARVDISYTSRNKISAVASHDLGGLSAEVADLLSPLKGRPLFTINGSGVEKASFPKQFLNDFHEKVLSLCSASSITVQNVAEQQWSQRYSFAKDGVVAVYDVWYNGKDRFTKCQPVITACSPDPLTGEVGQLLTEGMQG